MTQINALNLLCSANYCLNKLKPDTHDHACTMLEIYSGYNILYKYIPYFYAVKS